MTAMATSTHNLSTNIYSIQGDMGKKMISGHVEDTTSVSPATWLNKVAQT